MTPNFYKSFSNQFLLILFFAITFVSFSSFETQAQTVYVNAGNSTPGDGSNWANSYDKLQDALNDVSIQSTGGQIWVAAGTYYPDEGAGQTDNDRNATFSIPSNTQVLGGFAGYETAVVQRDWRRNETILSGDIEQNSAVNNSYPSYDFVDFTGNSIAIVTIDKVDNTVIDGFVIEYGYGENSPFTEYGTAISVKAFNSIGFSINSFALNNCIIRNNLSVSGSAVSVGSNEDNSVTGKIENCLFYKNESGSTPALSVQFSNKNNSINDELQVIGCTFSENVSTNTFPSPGAISYIAQTSNTANSPLFLRNSIIWNNTPGGGGGNASMSVSEGNTALYLQNNLLEAAPAFVDGANAGTNLIVNVVASTTDPAFNDANSGDFRPKAGSPALNNGSNAFPILATDLASYPRILGGTVNLGAYEILGPDMTLQSSTPAINADNIAFGAAINLTFNSTAIEAGTASATTIDVTGELAGPIATTVTSAGNNITVAPSTPFAPGELVTLTVTDQVRSTAGAPAEPSVFQFRVASPVAPAQFPFGQNIIGGGAGANFIQVADLDGDGDMDAYGTSAADDRVTWFENDNAGNFTANIVSGTADGAVNAHAADIDGDGKLDLISASTNDNRIAWYRNNLPTGFDPPIDIAVETGGAAWVHAADLDGDGDVDLTSASGNKVLIHKNLGGGNFGASETVTTATFATQSVYTADLDNDGDLDILSASFSDNKIAWYENDGKANFSAQKIITTTAISARSVYTADLDGDGDLDVLSAGGDGNVALYENMGTTTWPKTVVGTHAFSYNVYAADINGDGLQDVLSAGGTEIKLHLNTGTGFNTQLVANTGTSANRVFAADLDGDNDLDLLSAERTLNRFAWYENAPGPDVTINTLPAVQGNAIIGSDNNVLYGVEINPDVDVDLTAVTFTTAGGFSTGAIENAYLYYSTDNTFTLADAQLSNLSTTTTSSGGSLAFSGFTPRTIPAAGGYIFVVAKVNSSATISEALSIAAPTFTDFSFSTATTDNASALTAGDPVVIAPAAGNERPIGNTGIYFDGVDDRVEVGTSLNSLFNTGDFTLEVWVKQADLIDHALFSNRPVANNGFSFELQGTNVKFTLGGVNGIVVTGAVPNVNQWYHVAAVYDSPNVTIYVNGIEVGNQSVGVPFASSSPLYIGFMDYFNVQTAGQLDEARVFNTTRSAAQIQADMYSNQANGAVAYWNFDDDLSGGNQQNVVDIANGNNGTLGLTAGIEAADPLWAFRVTSTSNIGAGTLRGVLDVADNDTDKDYIDFSLSSGGIPTTVHQINLTTDLPAITHPIVLDGYSQLGASVNTTNITTASNAELRVELVGSGASNGLRFVAGAADSEVMGLSLYNFGSSAITIDDDDIAVWGNHLGTDATGVGSVTTSYNQHYRYYQWQQRKNRKLIGKRPQCHCRAKRHPN